MGYARTVILLIQDGGGLMWSFKRGVMSKLFHSSLAHARAPYLLVLRATRNPTLHPRRANLLTRDFFVTSRLTLPGSPKMSNTFVMQMLVR